MGDATYQRSTARWTRRTVHEPERKGNLADGETVAGEQRQAALLVARAPLSAEDQTLSAPDLVAATGRRRSVASARGSSDAGALADASAWIMSLPIAFCAGRPSGTSLSTNEKLE
jgi:hypothetical protein